MLVSGAATLSDTSPHQAHRRTLDDAVPPECAACVATSGWTSTRNARLSYRRVAQATRPLRPPRAGLAQAASPRAFPVGTNSRKRYAAAKITTPRRRSDRLWSLSGFGPQLPCEQASRDRAACGWDWRRCRSLGHQAAPAGGIQSQISGGDAGRCKTRVPSKARQQRPKQRASLRGVLLHYGCDGRRPGSGPQRME